MAILKKENVTLKENDNSKIKELEAIGYVKVDSKGNPLESDETKTVTLEEHNAALEELKKENTALKGQVTKLENAGKAAAETKTEKQEKAEAKK